MNAFSQAVFLPCGSTMKQRWRRSDRSGPTPRQRPCSAQQCSSRCSLTCQRRRELRSCCTEKWQLNGCKKQNKNHQPELRSHRDQLWASDINIQGSNWPPKSGQHQELSLRAPEDAVGLLLVKHLCRKKQKPALQCVSEAFQRIPHVFFLTYELDLSVVFDVVEGGADPRRLSVKNGKLAAVGFPRKRYDAFWNGNNWRSDFCLSLGFSLLCFLAQFLPFISTTSTGTCFSLIRKISKLVTTPWNGFVND